MLLVCHWPHQSRFRTWVRFDAGRLWRDPPEVFSPAAIASFEGKTLTFSHPDKLLTHESLHFHHAGHVQNVRKGTTPLESGDWAKATPTGRCAHSALGVYSARRRRQESE
jgi:Uncharacterized protein conserved in bacteria (DUF2213)